MQLEQLSHKVIESGIRTCISARSSEKIVHGVVVSFTAETIRDIGEREDVDSKHGLIEESTQRNAVRTLSFGTASRIRTAGAYQ
jgi:hypothetical protein